VASKDSNIGFKRARELREELGMEADEPISCLLTTVEEDLGIPVVVADLPQDVAGTCWQGEDGRVVVWVNGRDYVPRRRFTLAHELGHMRCGHDAGTPVDTIETMGGHTTNPHEIQANAFAAEFLAPAAGVREMAGDDPTLEHVVQIAARYGISAISALYRLNQLELTDRVDQLKQEIEEDLHQKLAAHLGLDLERDGDLLSAIDEESLPRLSPALQDSALAAVIEGRASVDDAAAMAGCDPDRISEAALMIGI
jgi:Zn-dependent peptidase ImmA (M78 family)